MKVFWWRPERILWVGLGTVFFLLFSQISFASSTTAIFQFSKKDLRFTKWKQFDKVTLPDGEVMREVGKPQLPVVVRRIPLPAGASILSIETVPADSIVLSGQYLIAPSQKPRVLSDKGPIHWISPDPAVYGSPRPYPRRRIHSEGAFSFFGKRFAEVLVYPLAYLPLRKKLVLYTKIRVTISYSNGNPAEKKPTQLAALPMDVREDITNFLGMKDRFSDSKNWTENSNSKNTIPYIIITDESLVDAFRPLADWKTQKGLRTKILTTQYISGKYYGRDLAEKIRGCIGFYHQFHGTLWVLLGGDTRFVPLRYAWAMDCEAHYAAKENDIPADVYFSDLDGIWDANKNGIFGEVRDRINLYPDVFVGRFSADSEENVRTMVEKVLTYEKNPPSDYTTRMLFLAMILWEDPYTDSGEGKDYIGDTFVPEQFKPITKLYESRGNESVQSATDAMNSGYNIINHDGHAWYNSMGMGNGYFGLSDADQLQNGPRYSILFSIGCWPGAFDKNCMAEHLTRNPNGGMVAFIGNSRYGWGSPGNPKFGYSDRFDQQFFRMIFKKKVSHIGEALALAKAVFVPFARQENVYRWCEYEINLFGDPEMPVWTNSPQSLLVELPEETLSDSSLITVTVRDSATGMSVENARVCFYQPGHVYETGFTDPGGQYSFFLQGATPDTSFFLTVTAPNFLPYERNLPVSVTGKFVRVVHARVDDAAGNGDSILNPGEKIRLQGFWKNFGTEPVADLQAVLHKNAKFTLLGDSSVGISSLAPGDSLAFEAFPVHISNAVKDGEVVNFSISIRQNGLQKWTSILPFVAGEPRVRIRAYRVDDQAQGNGNFIPDYGEHFQLRLDFENIGHGIARNFTIHLIPDSFWLKLDVTHFTIETLMPGAQTWVQTAAYVNPSPYLPPKTRPIAAFPIVISEIANTDTTFRDSIRISVGHPGFEYTPGCGCVIPWETGGNGNRWHFTTYRTHTDSVSWYCGDETTHRYDNNMDAYLRTIPFVADQKSQLSFWAWYDVTVYGTDGFYVEAKTDTAKSWKVLDFIGSGGALNPFLMGNGWLPYTYDLSKIPAGTTMQVQFRFVSDSNDRAEGVYIDHVVVKSQMETTVADFKGKNLRNRLPKQFALRQNYPNPFNHSTVIEYALPAPGLSGSFVIFNMLGQEVYSKEIGPQPVGVHRLIWDGNGQNGEFLQSGLYFYKIQIGKFMAIRKLLLIK